MIDWREIEAAAREQATAVLEARVQTPLEFGEHIAWGIGGFGGTTDALSDLHRVGVPQNDEPYTTCGEAIPHPIHWMTLSPALIRTMPPCRFCQAEYLRHIQDLHAQAQEHAA